VPKEIEAGLNCGGTTCEEMMSRCAIRQMGKVMGIYFDEKTWTDQAVSCAEMQG